MLDPSRCHGARICLSFSWATASSRSSGAVTDFFVAEWIGASDLSLSVDRGIEALKARHVAEIKGLGFTGGGNERRRFDFGVRTGRRVQNARKY